MNAQASSQPSPAPAEKAYLLPAPPGVGKTHAVISALRDSGTRCVYAAPTHALCEEVQKRLQRNGVSTHYWRPGPDEDDACPQMGLVQFYRDNGYIIRHGPCDICEKASRCSYRNVFLSKANEHAQVLIVTTWHLRRNDFWTLKATEDRALLILDEDACEALAAPDELTFNALSRFIASLQKLRDLCGDPFIEQTPTEEDASMIRRLMEAVEGREAELALTDILRRITMELMEKCMIAGDGGWHARLDLRASLTEYDLKLLGNNDLLGALIAAAYSLAMERVELPNIFGALRSLASSDISLYATPRKIQWSSIAIVPPSKRIVMLDATAQESVVTGVLKRPVESLTMPAVEQKARIYQVMDHLFTRNGTRKDAKGEDQFIRTFGRHVCQRHYAGKILVVTFLEHEEALQKYFDAMHPNITVCHYGALRGLDSFGDYEAGIIIGRPMPHTARLGLLAVSAFGTEVLDSRLRQPELKWTIREQTVGNDVWRSRIQQYEDTRWRAVWDHVVKGELLQAIGRLRPLSNPATIYILTCEPLDSTFEMQGIYASGLFPEMCLFGRRKDFAERVKNYAMGMQELTRKGTLNTNRNVCELIGMKEPNGLKYRELAKMLVEAST